MCGPFPAFREARAQLVTLVVALACVACAPYRPEPRDPEAMMQALQARTLDDPALRVRVSDSLHRPVPPWDLQALQEAASAWSPQLQLANAKREVTMQAARHAAQGPIPFLNIPLEYTTNPKPDESPYTIGIGLDIPIELGHKREAREAQADHLATAAAWDARWTELGVRGRVREQLLTYWSASRQARALDEVLTEQEQLLRLIDHRLQQGAVPSQDVYRARADLAQSRQRALDARRQASESLAAAAGAIGLTSAALSAADPQLDAFASTSTSQAPAIEASALAKRPEVQAALARYEATQAELQLAVANQYPDIHIGPGYTFDAGAHKIALSLTELPLVLLRDNRALIAEAVARRRQSGAELQKAVSDAFNSAEQAVASLQSARVGVEAAQAELSSQQRLLDAARRQFDAGEIDRVEFLRAQVQLNAARVDREAAQLQLQKAIGAIEQALPGKEWK